MPYVSGDVLCLQVLLAGLKIRAIVDLCIAYLDCGLCGVLGISLQVILGPVLNLVASLLGGLLGVKLNLTALLAVFVKVSSVAAQNSHRSATTDVCGKRSVVFALLCGSHLVHHPCSMSAQHVSFA
jgi:hypothetical protein